MRGRLHVYVSAGWGAELRFQHLRFSVCLACVRILQHVRACPTEAQTLYKHLMPEDVPRTWDDVCTSFKSCPAPDECQPCCDFEFDRKHGAAAAGKEVRHVPSRFTSGTRGKALIESFGAWFQTPKKSASAVVNFQDATVQLRQSASCQVQQMPKSSGNDCYVHIPTQLTCEADPEAVRRVRMFLATTFAGNPEGRLLDAAMEALALYSIPLPQKIIIMR